LLNSEFSFASARELADYVRRRAGANRDAQVRLVYRRTLGRPPTRAQLARAQEFLADREDESDDSLALLCLAVFNTNEFVYVD
jgi:hypothetical protein